MPKGFVYFVSWGKTKYMVLQGRIRTGSDCWFSKSLHTGLDRIQFLRIRVGLGVKNFTVRSSLVLITHEHGTGFDLDWIRTVANFADFRLDPVCRGAQNQDIRTRVLQDSAHFEQSGSDPVYGFIEVSGSGFSNFIVLGFDANTIMKRIFGKLKDVI